MQREFDFIIVGAGSAGGVLAYRLSQGCSARILLIEAGSGRNGWSTRMPAAARNNYIGGPRNWSFWTDPEPFMENRRLYQPRGKVIGGSSSLNGMVFVRGHPEDYNGWARAGLEDWAYDDVLPFFKSVESYKGVASAYRGNSGPIVVQRLTEHHPIENAFLEAAQMTGYSLLQDYNGAEQEGVTSFDANIHRGSRSGSAAACVGPAKSHDHFEILDKAHVTRIVTAGNKVTGIEFVRNGKLERARATREVILCAGAFQSPQLLMLSGIGPLSELKKHGITPVAELPGVGENLQDHLEVHVKFRAPRGVSQNSLLKRHQMVWAGLQWFLCKSGPASTTHSRVGAFLKTDPQKSYPNFQFHFWPYFLEGWSPPPDKDGFCFDVGPVRSASRGWVRLRSDNPLDAPVIQLNGLSTEEDMVEFRWGIAKAREIAALEPFDSFSGVEVSPGPEVQSAADLDRYIRSNANSAYHPCGTCRMGGDEMAVVDSRLRVHGIDGLRVADASIMPTVTNGNINAPCFMIGERAAHFVLADNP